MWMLDQPEVIRDRLVQLQNLVRDVVIGSRSRKDLHGVDRRTAADTIYAIDTAVEPVMEAFFEEWGRATPLVLVAEGLEGHGGIEGMKMYPRGAREQDAAIRVIVDPIDGTRGLMYDKRSAWALAGAAPQKGKATRLTDTTVAAMTELPTSKQWRADQISAVRGCGRAGVIAEAVDVLNGTRKPIQVN